MGHLAPHGWAPWSIKKADPGLSYVLPSLLLTLQQQGLVSGTGTPTRRLRDARWSRSIASQRTESGLLEGFARAILALDPRWGTG